MRSVASKHEDRWSTLGDCRRESEEVDIVNVWNDRAKIVEKA
jgi:hypothetical protein